MKIAALYQFKTHDPVRTKAQLALKAEEHQIVGMLMLAAEGINGTIAGEEESLKAFVGYLVADLGFDNLELKFSHFDPQQLVTADQVDIPSDSPFYRMRISIRKEIVTFGVPDLPATIPNNVHYIAPNEWNEVISREDTVVIDTRNDYEFDVGSFHSAVNPNTKTFRDFPSFIDQYLSDPSSSSSSSSKKNVAIFCTGGIRCEKASVYLAQLGRFEEIYQLKGGILKYLEEVPEETSLWEGECFVFDQRVSVRHRLEIGGYSLCRACRRPLSKEELSEEAGFLEGVHCRHCLPSLTPEKLQALQERQRQMALSRERNAKHLGYAHQPHQRRREYAKGQAPRQLRKADKVDQAVPGADREEARGLEGFLGELEVL
jgi:UPF0176 protein